MSDAANFAIYATTAAFAFPVMVLYGRWLLLMLFQREPVPHTARLNWVTIICFTFFFIWLSSTWLSVMLIADKVGFDGAGNWLDRHRSYLTVVRLGFLGLSLLAMHVYCSIAYHRTRVWTLVLLSLNILVLAFMVYAYVGGVW